MDIAFYMSQATGLPNKEGTSSSDAEGKTHSEVAGDLSARPKSDPSNIKNNIESRTTEVGEEPGQATTTEPVNTGICHSNNFPAEEEPELSEKPAAHGVPNVNQRDDNPHPKTPKNNRRVARPRRSTKRKSRDEPLLTVIHQLAGSMQNETVRIPLYQKDFDSLLPDEWLTDRAIDCLIFKHMISVDTWVCPLGTTFFQGIANAFRLQENGEEIPDEVTGIFNWGLYRYLLLPITGSDHISFAIIENPMSPADTVCYHVNSMRGCHDSEAIFAALKWFLYPGADKLNGHSSRADAKSFAYKTSPRQAHLSDCGVYRLHYMHKVAHYISEKSRHRLQTRWSH